MKRRKLMGLAAFLAICSTSFSSDFFTLDDVLNRVKDTNPQIRAQKMNEESKRELKEKAWKNLVTPPVNLSNEDEWEVVEKYGVGLKELEMYLPIFEGGRTLNNYKKAKTQYEIAQKDSDLVGIAAQEAAVAKFFEALNYKKQIEITDKAIEALEKQRERISDLYNNGKLVPKSELLKIEADIENNRGINLENKQKEEASLGELARLLNYPVNSPLELKDFNPLQFLEAKAHITEENKIPVENTLLGSKEALKLDSANYDVKIAKSALYPTIYTKYTYRYRYNDNGTLRKYDADKRDIFEVGFRWVLSWGADLDNVRSQEYLYEKAKIEYEDNLKGISLDMKNKLGEIKALYGKSLAMEKRANLLQENMDIDSMRYENELLTTFDYLNSVNSFREAQEDYYELQRKLVLAVIEYENLYR
ncbi:MAG: TolC family protein [Fusobacterium mortiferum]|uniref:TolC family protein n=1 Tax=Fusobacterium mortiferum TaxID=850 RepID=UPI00158E1F78|nr:TolC family protein [Fusobacterium mortiferum]MDY2802283.1 TolC family protein [Fusobacterium mortiferum]